MSSITVTAPSTIANLSVGFDILGLAVEAAADIVTVEKIVTPTVEIAQINGDFPKDPEKNTATVGLIQMIKDLDLDYGFRVSIKKGIPVGSGMGGSAASAVGAVVAAGKIIGDLSTHDLLKYAILGEAIASGAVHADNVAPCMMGGLVLIRSAAPVDVIRLKCPSFLHCVLVHPNIAVHTKEARAILRPTLPLKDHVKQSGNLAAFLAGCYTEDRNLIARSLEDIVIEPQREKLIPGFRSVQTAALRVGALGCGISGSGPSMFALVDSMELGQTVRSEMVDAFHKAGIPEVDAWVCPVATEGAQVVV